MANLNYTPTPRGQHVQFFTKKRAVFQRAEKISIVPKVLMNSTINCVSNNVKGLHDKSKRIKMFLYLKDLISNNGFIFLQESHSSAQETTQWCNDFGSQNNIFFSHGRTIGA